MPVPEAIYGMGNNRGLRFHESDWQEPSPLTDRPVIVGWPDSKLLITGADKNASVETYGLQVCSAIAIGLTRGADELRAIYMSHAPPNYGAQQAEYMFEIVSKLHLWEFEEDAIVAVGQDVAHDYGKPHQFNTDILPALKMLGDQSGVEVQEQRYTGVASFSMSYALETGFTHSLECP